MVMHKPLLGLVVVALAVSAASADLMDIFEIKRTFGKQIALMGNLHTTEVMLHGTPDTVREEAKWCIDVAAEGGGFILSTGDQCGRDTPDENIRALVEFARDYGKY